jgi:hypothetical protein
MCALKNFLWWGEPYFAVSAISIGDILPQIPREGKHKWLRFNNITIHINILYFFLNGTYNMKGSLHSTYVITAIETH